MLMSDLPLVVDTDSIVNFSGFGDITVGVFDNNGTNAKIHQCHSENNYAVKIHRAKKKQNNELNLDFTSELRFDVNHELICKPLASSIVDLQQNRASLVILMPQLFDYEMLRDFSKTNHLAIADKIGIVKLILEGINTIHRQGWLHGDLSDRNIMIKRETLDVKFIDFEWSVKIEETESSIDEVRGTLEMVSPEVRHFGTMKALSEKSEIWSVCKIILQIFDNSILKQFKQVDDIGFRTYLNKIGLDVPMYKLNSKHESIREFVELVEKGTCGNSNLRPSIDELLQKLTSIKLESNSNNSFSVEPKLGSTHDLDNDSIGLEIILNNSKRCMVRRGKIKSFTLEDNITMQINFTAQHPNISVSRSGQNHPVPLTLGTRFGIGDNKNLITGINNL